ncbi:MAG: hypothetical protein EXX96DRAFT_609141 [Benjaminiella poitrasii]|nr:MAG: hypothetical protein EXX96DRAFT_609141 [Benjaminiella poitrasii]
MKKFLDMIPRTTDIKAIFAYLNNLVIDPYEEYELCWLKTSLQQAADLFITRYLPITDHSERDIIRSVWGFVDTAYDSSELTFGRHTAEVIMGRQRAGEIPDMKIFCGRYEFGVGEVRKNESDTTKEINDGSIKLGKMIKSMLLNLTKDSPKQHQMKIVGMFFSGVKMNFLELYNLFGHVCILKKTKELYFPERSKEFIKPMIPLVEQVWIHKMEMESRLDSMMVS